MATKLNVPLFNEGVDVSSPGDAAGKFVGMAGGAALAILAIGAGQWAINRGAEAAGAGNDIDFEVI